MVRKKDSLEMIVFQQKSEFKPETIPIQMLIVL